MDAYRMKQTRRRTAANSEPSSLVGGVAAEIHLQTAVEPHPLNTLNLPPVPSDAIALNPQPEALSLKPSSLNPQPQALNPKP